MSVHQEMARSQRIIGLGGAVVGIGVGLWGATRRAAASLSLPTERGRLIDRPKTVAIVHFDTTAVHLSVSAQSL